MTWILQSVDFCGGLDFLLPYCNLKFRGAFGRLGDAVSKKFALSLVLVWIFVSACQHNPDPVNGKKLAEENCVPCHDITGTASIRHAPPLWGISGRPLGNIKNFTYSPDFQEQIKKGFFIWNESNLERFLKNPRALFPNNRMSAWNPAMPPNPNPAGKDLASVRASLASAGHYETVEGFKNMNDVKDIVAFLKTLKNN